MTLIGGAGRWCPRKGTFHTRTVARSRAAAEGWPPKPRKCSLIGGPRSCVAYPGMLQSRLASIYGCNRELFPGKPPLLGAAGLERAREFTIVIYGILKNRDGDNNGEARVALWLGCSWRGATNDDWLCRPKFLAAKHVDPALIRDGLCIISNKINPVVQQLISSRYAQTPKGMRQRAWEDCSEV